MFKVTGDKISKTYSIPRNNEKETNFTFMERKHRILYAAILATTFEHSNVPKYTITSDKIVINTGIYSK